MLSASDGGVEGSLQDIPTRGHVRRQSRACARTASPIQNISSAWVGRCSGIYSATNQRHLVGQQSTLLLRACLAEFITGLPRVSSWSSQPSAVTPHAVPIVYRRLSGRCCRRRFLP